MRITIDTATDGVKEAEHAIAIIGAFYELGDAKISLTGPTPEQMAQSIARKISNMEDASHGLPYPGPSGAAMVPGSGMFNQPMVSGAPGSSTILASPPAERTAAETFAGNGVSPPVLPPGALPLPVAPSTAGAMPLPNAPGALPGSLVPPVTAAPVPPTAPLAPVPMAPAIPPVPPAPALAGGVELDAEGIPWDARIHQSTKGKTAKGVWKQRKGLNDDAMIARVKAELRAVAANPAAAVAPVATPPAPFTAPAAPSAPALPGVPSDVRPDPTTALELMPRYTPAVHAGLIPAAALQDACVAYGLANVPALSRQPEYVGLVWAYMKQQHPAFAASNP